MAAVDVTINRKLIFSNSHSELIKLISQPTLPSSAHPQRALILF